MAVEVGSVGSVDGVEPSDSMLALARGRRPPAAAAEIRFVAGDACALPFGEEEFDAAVATQVYEYVPDVKAALGEAFRVLRPGGRLLVLDTDWASIVWHSRDPNTLSAGMIGFITAFVPGRQGLNERDARDWPEDLKTLGDDYFFSLNRYLFLAME